MSEYHKIKGPFLRHTDGPNRNKVIPWAWSEPEFEYLAGLSWEWTEKIDGTNIRIIWDGHRVEFGGRTANAQIPATLLSKLRELFPEELMEQKFGQTPCILYGEGYGPKIQKGGGNYRTDQSFILFDVKVGDWWLGQGDVTDVANKLGIDRVPVVGTYSVFWAIGTVSNGLTSGFGGFFAEGLVGRPMHGITSRKGDRLLMKVKHADLFGMEL